MPPVNTKEKMALHLFLRPSDLSTAGVKDKELFIHNTLHRGSTDRTSVGGEKGAAKEIWNKEKNPDKSPRYGKREEEKRKKE